MDHLQIQHAISQIEIYSEQLKEHLTQSTVDPVELNELRESLDEANSEVDDLKEEVTDLKVEIDDLKDSAKQAKEILEDLLSDPAGEGYSEEKLQEAINLL